MAQSRPPPLPESQIPPPSKVSESSRIGGWYIINKTLYQPDQFDAHREWLTIRPLPNSDYKRPKKKSKIVVKKGKKKKAKTSDDENSESDEPELEQELEDGTFSFFMETEKEFYFPICYGLFRWGPVQPLNDQRYTGDDIPNMKFEGNLFPYQLEACNKAIDILLNPSTMDSCIFKCPCGFGKTICSIYIMTVLKKKTLFLAATEMNLTSIIEELTKFTPSLRIGIIQKDKLEIEDKDVVIAMKPTLWSRKYPPELFKSFGFSISDEAHHDGANTYFSVCGTMWCKYKLALSATPRRGDGRTSALRWMYGPIIESKIKNFENVDVNMVRIYSSYTKEIKYKDGIIGKDAMITIQSRSFYRNCVIVSDIIDCHRRTKKSSYPSKIIVFVERLLQIGIITVKHKNVLPKKIKLKDNNILSLLFSGLFQIYNLKKNLRIDTSLDNQIKLVYDKKNGIPKTIYSVGHIVGGIKREQIKSARECDTILANYHQAKEILNVPERDITMLCSEKGYGSVEQPSGRVLRLFPGKIKPCIYYYWNQFSFFLDRGTGAEKYFKQSNYTLSYRDVNLELFNVGLFSNSKK